MAHDSPTHTGLEIMQKPRVTPVPEKPGIHIMRLVPIQLEPANIEGVGQALSEFTASGNAPAGGRTLIVDFSQVGQLLNTAMLGGLVAANQHLHKQGGQLILAGIKPDSRAAEVLRITRCNKIFTQSESVPAAIQQASLGR